MLSAIRLINVGRMTSGLGLALFCWTGSLAAQGPLLDGARVSGVPIRGISPGAPSAAVPPLTRGALSDAAGPVGESRRAERPIYPTRTIANHAPVGAVEVPPAYAAAVTDATLPNYISPTVEVLSPASTQRQTQQEALALIPWNDLNSEGRRKIKDVVDNPSIYRRLPVSRIQCDPQFYQFSIRNPETIVGLWQAFGVTTMGLERTGPYTFSGGDGAGTDCTAELVYGDNEKHIYVGTGTYQGPVFRRKVTGHCVVILKTDTAPGAQQYSLTNQMDIFLRVDNLAADMIARTLQPMVGRTADHNFNESLLFLQAFSETAAHDPQRVEQLVQQLTQVEPETRHQFKQVVTTVPDRQQQYRSAAGSR